MQAVMNSPHKVWNSALIRHYFRLDAFLGEEVSLQYKKLKSGT